SSPRKQVRLTKARQVGRYEMKGVGEKRNQIAEHVAGARKPVQQQQGWSLSPAGFAIRNLEAANLSKAIINLLHRNLPLDYFCPTLCVDGRLDCILAQRKGRAIAGPRCRPPHAAGAAVKISCICLRPGRSTDAIKKHRTSRTRMRRLSRPN